MTDIAQYWQIYTARVAARSEIETEKGKALTISKAPRITPLKMLQ